MIKASIRGYLLTDMARGQQNLFNQLFPSSIKPEPTSKSKRNAYLEDRNDALACRYFYLAHIQRKRYDDCLVQLSKEFFLTTGVIIQCLTTRQAYIKNLINSECTVIELKKRYPHYVWAA